MEKWQVQQELFSPKRLERKQSIQCFILHENFIFLTSTYIFLRNLNAAVKNQEINVDTVLQSNPQAPFKTKGQLFCRIFLNLESDVFSQLDLSYALLTKYRQLMLLYSHAAYQVAPDFDFLITHDVHFDHLIKVMSVSLLHYNVNFSPL